MTKETPIIEGLIAELKMVLTHQLAPIYNWSRQGQQLCFYDICDDLILSIDIQQVELEQVDPKVLKDSVTLVLSQLEKEGYLILEPAEVPEEDILLETFFMTEPWETAYLDDLPIGYHEEDPDLEDYYFEP